MYYSEDFKRRVKQAYPRGEVLARLLEKGAAEVGVYLKNAAKNARRYGAPSEEIKRKEQLFQEWEKTYGGLK